MRPALTLAAVMLAAPAAAHDWYPYSCCSNRDCFEVDEGALVYDEHADEWIYVATGQRFAADLVRTTPHTDPKTGADIWRTWHVCTLTGKPDEPVRADGSGYCVWIPEAGG